MEFTCNPIKNETNIRDRGLPLLTAARLLLNSLAGTRRYPQGIPEAAFYRLYNTIGRRLIVVVFCGPVDDHITLFYLEMRIDVSRQKLKTKSSEIAWAAVDVAPLADVPDEDSPELTAAEFVELRPVSEVLLGLGLGKQRITIMLDEAVVQAYKAKAGGRRYQTLINDTLRRALEADSVKEALREVIREELHRA
ncbi:MAG: BrnA antitoxin family protein [Methylococcales bacterium]|nr:BrnA antitoxin family protein [Methylococcales bacterium]